MKKFIQVLVLILIIPFHGKSQQLGAGFQSGFGTFSMTDLKSFNTAVIGDLPFDSKTVHDFPMYLFYRPYILMNIWRISFGPVYIFQSTGSRVSAKDYSGEYRFDMILNSHAPGIYTEGLLKSPGRFQYSIYSIFGGLFSNMKMIEYLKVWDEIVTNSNIKFKAKNLFLESGFNIRYPVKFLEIGINAGYQFRLGGKPFYFENNKEAQLINIRTGDPVRAGWNGLRIGLSISYALKSAGKSR
jgi:hypothetical protein